MGKLLRDDTFLSASNEENALLEIIASDKVSSISSNWASVQRLVRDGYAPYIYSAGDQFQDTWIDTSVEVEEGDGQSYEYPWHIADFKNVTLENAQSVPGMIIQAHYAHPFGVQFDHQRAFLACPEGLSAGTYYFTFASSWGSNISAGDAVSFTTSENIPANGCIAGCYGAPDTPKSNWRIYTYAADRKTILETITPTFTASGSELGTMQTSTRDGNLNSAQEMAYGHNRWATSALRQYLNSDKPKNEWWTLMDDSDPDYPWEIAPDELSTKDGFLCGMPSELLQVIKPVKVVTYKNTVQDGGEEDITYDKVFLASLEEMHISPQIEGEGSVWEYWKRVSASESPLAQEGTYPQMITYDIENHSSAQDVGLRSASRGNAGYMWFVNSSGGVGNVGASNSIRFTPACIIC